LEWLKALSESDVAMAVRKAAVQELMRGWSHDAEIAEFLASMAEPREMKDAKSRIDATT